MDCMYLEDGAPQQLISLLLANTRSDYLEEVHVVLIGWISEYQQPPIAQPEVRNCGMPRVAQLSRHNLFGYRIATGSADFAFPGAIFTPPLTIHIEESEMGSLLLLRQSQVLRLTPARQRRLQAREVQRE